MRKALALIAICFVLPGCATFQDWHYDTVNGVRAECAWAKSAKNPLDIVCPSDYGHGWKHGYLCVATGGDGHPPTLPPKKYWSAIYQSPAGQEEISQWYTGFQAGAQAAEHCGIGQFHYLRPYGMVAACPPTSDNAFPPPGEVFGDSPSSITPQTPAAQPLELPPPGENVPADQQSAPGKTDPQFVPTAGSPGFSPPLLQPAPSQTIERLPLCPDTAGGTGISPVVVTCDHGLATSDGGSTIRR